MKTTKSDWTPFLKFCSKEFRFLENEYGFTIKTHESVENKIVYENKTTAVIISLDAREQGVSVYIGRKDRKLADQLDSWCYDLGDIVVPKNPMLGNEYQETDIDWEQVLKRRASDLQKYALETLTGDFSSFRLAQKEIDKRKANK